MKGGLSLRITKWYDGFIVLLAFVSIIFVLLDFASLISIAASPYLEIDNFILIIFSIDYFARLVKSENKLTFFKQNIFDLLAIIPFSAIFSFFRFSRIFRIAKISKFARLSRLVGVTGKLQQKLSKFLNTNGFIYLVYVSLFLLILSSALYSVAENVPFDQALWWAIATTTTVGYGDISPATGLGRIAAVVLMILGIGMIGMLTSTITEYFTRENSNNQATDSVETLHKKIDLLIEKIEKLENRD